MYALDTWLRRREAVFEFSSDPDCIFRIQDGSADRNVILKDGTHVREGDPIVVLHLWNEQLPVMSRSGHSVGWAREVSRKIAGSLAALEAYMARKPEYDPVVALAADIALGSPEDGEKILRLAARYGFESVGDDAAGEPRLRQLGQNTLMLLLVLATNPASANMSVLRRQRRSVYLSRAKLRSNLARADAGVGRQGEAKS